MVRKIAFNLLYLLIIPITATLENCLLMNFTLLSFLSNTLMTMNVAMMNVMTEDVPLYQPNRDFGTDIKSNKRKVWVRLNLKKKIIFIHHV